MRWVALGVDYEMAGKDLINSVKLSERNLPRARRHAAGRLQLRALPRRERPEDFQVEGQRAHHRRMAALRQPGKPVAVHVSRAEGGEAALLRRHPAPRRRISAISRRLSAGRAPKERLGNPVWHIHAGAPPKADNPVPFAMLLSLVTASNAENADTLWGFIGRYRPGVTRQTHPHLAAMVEYAIHYFRDFVLPAKKFREPTDGRARRADRPARCAVAACRLTRTAEEIQDVVYEVGRREPFLDAEEKGQGRQARRLARLVQHALSGAARPGERPALRLLRRRLRHQEHHRHDRRRARPLGVIAGRPHDHRRLRSARAHHPR